MCHEESSRYTNRAACPRQLRGRWQRGGQLFRRDRAVCSQVKSRGGLTRSLEHLMSEGFGKCEMVRSSRRLRHSASTASQQVAKPSHV
jgi:hypothetical protein